MIRIFRDSPRQAMGRLNSHITELNNLFCADMPKMCLCSICDHLHEWHENVWDCLAKDVETPWSQDGPITECKQFRAIRNWQTMFINMQNEVLVEAMEALEFSKGGKVQP